MFVEQNIAIGISISAIAVITVGLISWYNYKPNKRKINKIKSNNESKSKKNKSNNVIDDFEDNATSESIDVLKGYKRLSNGNKTSYFHRDISDKDKEIIGDCTPKKLDSSNDIIDSSPRKIETSNDNLKISAWNEAGTFEERNITSWTQKQLKLLFNTISYDIILNDNKIKSIKVSVTSIDKIDGDSIITYVRNKKKFIYDLSIELRWKSDIFMSNGRNLLIQGHAIVSDISAEDNSEISIAIDNQINDYEINLPLLIKKYFNSNSIDQNSIRVKILSVCKQLLEELKSSY